MILIITKHSQLKLVVQHGIYTSHTILYNFKQANAVDYYRMETITELYTYMR